ncbi:MAG: hypothetical protein ACE5G0_17665 [Rhodothermales bacterium]
MPLHAKSHVFSSLLVLVLLALPASAQNITVTGPLPPGDGVPPHHAEDSFSLVYQFETDEAVTLVQHSVALITVYCEDDGRQIGHFESDFWEYFSFTEGGSTEDIHQIDGSNIIEHMVTTSTSFEVDEKEPPIEIDTECECYRIEFINILTIFEGTLTQTGSPTEPLPGGVGTFGVTNVDGKPAPSVTWEFDDPNNPGQKIESANAVEGIPVDEATIDESHWWTIQHRGTIYVGEGCTDEHENTLPNPEHDVYRRHEQ